MSNIGQLIQKIMKKRDMRMIDIALKAELTSEMAIRMYIWGKATMPIERQKILAKNLGLSIESFKKAHLADIKAMY